MRDDQEPVADELSAGAVQQIPGIGWLMAPLARGLSRSIREETKRNTSKALRAAERISGMNREELSDRISENPRLVPLVTRVLYTAGMTGQDTILKALGTALGEAVRNSEKIDEAELLLVGMADLREYHIDILKNMTERRPHPKEPETFIYWTSQSLTEKTNYDRDIVNICLAGLVRSGLIRTVDDAYGMAYEISTLGLIALEVLDHLET